MNTAHDFYVAVAFASIMTLLVGVAACFSGLLRVDGRLTTWNLANLCAQAYGNCSIQRCNCLGSPK